MDTRTRTLILIGALLALATMLYVVFTGGELLQRSDQSARSTEWQKPTTGILKSMRGTATAEAEKATPEPEAKLPGMKAAPQQGLEDWWFDLRFPSWVSA